MDNPLSMGASGPQAEPQPGQMDGTPMAPSPSGIPQEPQGEGQLVGAYAKLKEARGRMDVIQNVLGKLVELGTNVSPDDVVDSAGKIVAAGVSPEGMASMLAEMPEQPELLAAWLAEHKGVIDQKEKELDLVTRNVQHEMGVQALRGLLGQQAAQDIGQALGAASNPLEMSASTGAPGEE